MGRSRQELHDLLLLLTPNVYFQPPESVKMKYPAIVYERDNGDSKFADNSTYDHTRRYQVTVIDEDPDGFLYEVLVLFPMCLHSRFFAVEDLNHDIFNLYF